MSQTGQMNQVMPTTPRPERNLQVGVYVPTERFKGLRGMVAVFDANQPHAGEDGALVAVFGPTRAAGRALGIGRKSLRQFERDAGMLIAAEDMMQALEAEEVVDFLLFLRDNRDNRNNPGERPAAPRFGQLAVRYGGVFSKTDTLDEAIPKMQSHARTLRQAALAKARQVKLEEQA